MFPNVKHLVWVDADLYYDEEDETDIVSARLEDLGQKLVTWKDVKHLYEASTHLRISTALLESCTLVRLKYIQLTGCFGRSLKVLLSNIKNASYLERFSLKRTSVDLDDLEQLYSGSPNLKALSLDYIENGDDSEENTAIIDTAKSVKSINFNWSNESSAQLIKWIVYIGKKYSNLEVLKLDNSSCFWSRFPMVDILI